MERAQLIYAIVISVLIIAIASSAFVYSNIQDDGIDDVYVNTMNLGSFV